MIKMKTIPTAALALLCLSGCTGDVTSEDIDQFVRDCRQKGGTAKIEGSLNSFFPSLDFSCSLPAPSAQSTTKE